MKMGNFVQAGLLEVGQLITFKNGEQIIIGNATMYHEDTTNDGGIGWDWNDAREILKVENLVAKDPYA